MDIHGKENIDAAELSQADITDSKPFKQKVSDWKFGQRENRKRAGTMWADERKRDHSERMTSVWTQRNVNLSSWI